MDKDKHLGRWWVPDNPRRRVFGVLEAAPSEDIVHTVAGGIDTTSRKLTILGETRAGEPVTLARCIPRGITGRGGFTNRLDEVQQQSFFAHEALFGGRYATGEEARFRFTEVDYDNLPEWIGESTLCQLTPDSKEVERGIGIKRGREESVRYGDTEIGLRIGTGRSFARGTVTLSPAGRMHFFSRRARTLKEWNQEFLTPIGYLLSFALGKACSVASQSVLEHAPWWTYVKKARRPPEVRVQRGERTIGTQRIHGGPFFTLADDGIVFEDVVSRWLSSWPELKLPMDMYFDTVFGRYAYLELSFLSLVQAAEGYHRVRMPILLP